jgi:hypothetical protein
MHRQAVYQAAVTARINADAAVKKAQSDRNAAAAALAAATPATKKALTADLKVE